MEYEEKEDSASMVSEPAVAYLASSKARWVEIESECLTLVESKQMLLEKVHQHYHPEV